MRVWRGLVAVLAWLLAVAVVAGVAWFAIDSAGRQVGSAGPVTVVRPVAGVAGVPVVTGSAGPTGSPSATRTAGPSGTPSGTASGTTSVTPSTVVPTAREVAVSPSGSAGVSSSGSAGVPPSGPSVPGPRPGAATPGPTAPSLPPWPGPGRNGTYSSAAGDLAVRCAGERIEGWGLRPADGWRADAAPGPRGDLVVVFTSGDGRVVEVGVTCRNGMPVFGPWSPQG